jgi:uncharacterized protein YkwD
MKNILFFMFIMVMLFSCNQDDVIIEDVILGEITSDKIDEVEILRLVNQIRTVGYELNTDTNKFITSSLKPLIWDDKLFKASQFQSTYMFETNHYSHDWIDGTDLSKRLKMSECYYRPAVENIAKGHRNEKEVIKGWLNSKPHREAILTGVFNSIAVSKRGIYWTMVLGYKSPDGYY